MGPPDILYQGTVSGPLTTILFWGLRRLITAPAQPHATEIAMYILSITSQVTLLPKSENKTLAIKNMKGPSLVVHCFQWTEARSAFLRFSTFGSVTARLYCICMRWRGACRTIARQTKWQTDWNKWCFTDTCFTCFTLFGRFTRFTRFTDSVLQTRKICRLTSLNCV